MMTYSWALAEAFSDHMTGRGLLVKRNARPSKNKLLKIQARIGDVYSVNFLGEGEDVDHLAFVTGIASDGTPLLSYHSEDNLDIPWSDFVNRVTSSKGSYPEHWNFDRWRVSRTRFND